MTDEQTIRDLERQVQQLADQREDLCAENARLRAALFDLTEADAGNWDTMHPDLARQRARAVLSSGTSE